jgi:trehalose/maltose hydrolase-like predicted phosphorylase
MADEAGREWLIEEEGFDPERELYWETVFALSNGYMAARGTPGENHAVTGIRSYFGTYVAGIFDKYSGDYQSIVNLADFFQMEISINGELVSPAEGMVDNYRRHLDMQNGLLVRRFTWVGGNGQRTSVEITRFISRTDLHLAVQHVRLKPLDDAAEIRIENTLDGNVANIDFHVSGYQLRDEKYYFIADEHEAGHLDNGSWLTLRTKSTGHRISELFACACAIDGDPCTPENETETNKRLVRNRHSITVNKDSECTFYKTIAVHTSNDEPQTGDLVSAAQQTAEAALANGYEDILQAHCDAWKKLWNVCNMEIEGNERDQRNVRFNIFHLIQMGTRGNTRINIGSRGLTSEMHYGNCFWDTEIFILPFFIYTDPDTARALVQYRHRTLPEARAKARSQWLEGAMFPWMSSWPGKEQADYWEYANIAIHIVSDVVYGLMHYCEATGDRELLMNEGLELLVETARFWTSRVDYSPEKEAYVLNVVKGPNEYAIADNNTYTNWNARWNLATAASIISSVREDNPERYAELLRDLDLKDDEPQRWDEVAGNMYIHYDEDQELYAEDDAIFSMKPADLKKLKPGKKITTELGLPWDMLLRLKIVKQADVLLLMFLHREQFTREQLEKAWDYYEPITLHDSSLSYNTHSIIANELGNREKSYDYFQQTARLDLEDVMANVFLGIHAANAGGTWMCVLNGFAGMRREENVLRFEPHLPDSWNRLRFKVYFHGNLFAVTIEGEKVTITLEGDEVTPCRIEENRIISEAT